MLDPLMSSIPFKINWYPCLLTLLQKAPSSRLLQSQRQVAHRGRWQWVMLWSWWVVCRLSRAARCPCITSDLKKRGETTSFNCYPLQPISCFGHFYQHYWMWKVKSCVGWKQGRLDLCHWETLSRALWIISRPAPWIVTLSWFHDSSFRQCS